MSVYTATQPQQLQQTYGQQQPYGQQQQYGQPQPQPWQQYGQLSPMEQFPTGQQPRPGYHQLLQQLQQSYGQQFPTGQQVPHVVTELAMRCAATAVASVVEQLRIDQQALMGIQSQGQIPPHALGSVLTECARRIAPELHTVLSGITQGQQFQGGQFQGQYGYPQQQLTGQPWGTPQMAGISPQQRQISLY